VKITYEAYGATSVVTTDHDDVDAAEVQQLLVQMLLGAGWHPETVKSIINQED